MKGKHFDEVVLPPGVTESTFGKFPGLFFGVFCPKMVKCKSGKNEMNILVTNRAQEKLEQTKIFQMDLFYFLIVICGCNFTGGYKVLLSWIL